MKKTTWEYEGEQYQAPRGTWTSFPLLCKGCGLCIEKCPTHVIEWSEKLSNYGTPRVTVRADGCIVCNQCAMHCPDAAINVVVTKKKESGKKEDESN